jgi:hypothetical protein
VDNAALPAVVPAGGETADPAAGGVKTFWASKPKLVMIANKPKIDFMILSFDSRFAQTFLFTQPRAMTFYFYGVLCLNGLK